MWLEYHRHFYGCFLLKMHAGGNFESIGTREESQVDKAPALAQSVDYVVTNKKEDDHAVTQAHPELKAANDERMIVQEETLSSKKGAEKYFISYYLKQKLPEITQDRSIGEQLKP